MRMGADERRSTPMARMIVIISAAVVIVGLGAYGFATVSEGGEATHPRAPVFEHVHALAFDATGRSLWLGAHTGLYRSADGGRTWTKVLLPASDHGPDVMGVTPHPAESDVLYVGTHEAGVLKSIDGGRTWAAVNAGLRGLDVHGLAIDPNAPSKLHALVREAGAGLYRTTDSGQK